MSLDEYRFLFLFKRKFFTVNEFYAKFNFRAFDCFVSVFGGIVRCILYLVRLQKLFSVFYHLICSILALVLRMFDQMKFIEKSQTFSYEELIFSEKKNRVCFAFARTLFRSCALNLGTSPRCLLSRDDSRKRTLRGEVFCDFSTNLFRSIYYRRCTIFDIDYHYHSTQ